MNNFLKIVSVYVGVFFFFSSARMCGLLVFKYAFICIPNKGCHIRIFNSKDKRQWINVIFLQDKHNIKTVS